ncbi:hypothetical protein [Anabaena sp. CA = ATCC 33047]|uniref:hypothetical protein n=1 Tax=Anabaena sp. (strain CA / ATCC 33047) TaxID=52271 RepID=UPI00082B79CE|nr:hypothetical protein [Anabaena sp. CA = ATCC 33047]
MSQPKPPLFDFFILMRDEAGLSLTIDQYYLLIEALHGGFGLASLEELKQVCRLLWLKPKSSIQAAKFDQYFDDYFRQDDDLNKIINKDDTLKSSANQQLPDKQKDEPTNETEKDVTDTKPQQNLPEIPVVPIALRTQLLPKKPYTDKKYQFDVIDFPVTERQIQRSWRYLRHPIREGELTEIDIEATIAKICQEGIFLEPVLIPNRINRAELLLLIDASNSMIPFNLLSQKLVDHLQGGRLGKAQTYYFRNCPQDYLYFHPQRPEAQLLHELLPKLHTKRTVALIISDAGAARGGINRRRIELTKEFLIKLGESVRHIAWLNPVPEERWLGTTAGYIQELVPMFELDSSGIKAAMRVGRG